MDLKDIWCNSMDLFDLSGANSRSLTAEKIELLQEIKPHY
jgi:hypothetical protein